MTAGRSVGYALLAFALTAAIWLVALLVIFAVALDECGWLPFLDQCTDAGDSDALIIGTLVAALGLSIATAIWSVRRARGGGED